MEFQLIMLLFYEPYTITSLGYFQNIESCKSAGIQISEKYKYSHYITDNKRKEKKYLMNLFVFQKTLIVKIKNIIVKFNLSF